MKRHRHTPEQIVRKLREGDRLLNEGKDLTEVLRHLGVSESSWNRWRSQYGGMKANEAKRLRELEPENARLKRLLAEAELDKAMLKELAGGGRAPAAGLQAQEHPAFGRRAAATRRAAEPRVGHRLPVRRVRGSQEAEAVQHRRRTHPRGPRHGRHPHLHRR